MLRETKKDSNSTVQTKGKEETHWRDLQMSVRRNYLNKIS